MTSEAACTDIAVGNAMISCDVDDSVGHAPMSAEDIESSSDDVDVTTFVMFGLGAGSEGPEDNVSTEPAERHSADWTKSVPESWVGGARFTEDEAKVLRTFSKTQWGGFPWREYQLKVTLALLRGKDALAIVPTGLGKSAPYSVLPGLREAAGRDKFIVVVFQPLVCLIADQTKKLEALYPGRVVSLTGQTTKDEVQVTSPSGVGTLIIVPRPIEAHRH